MGGGHRCQSHTIKALLGSFKRRVMGRHTAHDLAPEPHLVLKRGLSEPLAQKVQLRIQAWASARCAALTLNRGTQPTQVTADPVRLSDLGFLGGRCRNLPWSEPRSLCGSS